MAGRHDRNPGSWFRWQMRPRIDETEEPPRNDARDLPTPEELKAEELKDEKLELEKGDLTALIGSAMLTIFPICVLVLLGICLVVWFLFFH